MQKKFFFFLIFLFLFLPQAVANGWQVERSRHFVIYHQGADSGYLSRLASQAESYYRNITRDLGFQRFNFWLWDDRCEIYLYPSQQNYLQETGNIAWSRAHVNIIEKRITTYIGQPNFFDTVLPHEMAHIIFREFVGFDKRLPLWLDEGVAMLAEADIKNRLLLARRLVEEEAHLSIGDLSRIRGYSSIDPALFYSQSASLVNFLLERYGRRNFVDFCRQLRDRDNWQDALRRAYDFSSPEALEQAWLTHLLN